MGAPVDGIILANMERDVLKREEIDMNKLGDEEVGDSAFLNLTIMFLF